MPLAAIQMRNTNLLLSVLYFWSVLHSAYEGNHPCVKSNDLYFCTSVPIASSYPPHLKHLLLKVDNGIGFINSSVFNSSSLVSVTNLTISDSNVTNIIQGAFNSFLDLAVLILDKNKLSIISTSWFTNPASLVKLSLVGNRIHAINVWTLSNFSNLTELDLSQNAINTIDDQSFQNNLKLSILNLSTNKLNFVQKEAFAELPLQNLGLWDNPWTCTCKLKDLAIFLGGLVNISALDNKSSVTCSNPPNLHGTPVWNISDFGCMTNTSEFDCMTNASTDSNIQHATSEKLLPKLLGLLGLPFILLLLKMKKEKQILPGKQTSSKQENELPTWVLKENSNVEGSGSGVDVNKKCQVMATISGVQQVNKIVPKDLAEVTTCKHEISNVSTAQLFIEEWESEKNKRVTSKQEKETCSDIPYLETYDQPLVGIFDDGTVTNSQTLVMSSLQNQRGSDVTKWNRKPVGTIVPLSKMTTDDGIIHTNMNPDENMAVTTTVRCERHEGVRNLLTSEKLTNDMSEICDLDINEYLMSCVTERQHGKESEMPDRNGSKGNISLIERRVGNESRLKSDENSTKCFSGVDNPTSLPREDLSTTKRGFKYPEPEILPSSRCGQATSKSEAAVDTSSPTKDNHPRGSDYGYINLLHEIVENQGRRTRERWKQSHRFRVMH